MKSLGFSTDKVISSVKTIMKWSEIAQSCLTLCNPMYCSLPGSSVHGIFQARVLAWGAIACSRSSRSRDWTQVSCIVGRCFTVWATREVISCGEKNQHRLLEYKIRPMWKCSFRHSQPLVTLWSPVGTRLPSWYTLATRGAYTHLGRNCQVQPSERPRLNAQNTRISRASCASAWYNKRTVASD